MMDSIGSDAAAEGSDSITSPQSLVPRPYSFPLRAADGAARTGVIKTLRGSLGSILALLALSACGRQDKLAIENRTGVAIERLTVSISANVHELQNLKDGARVEVHGFGLKRAIVVHIAIEKSGDVIEFVHAFAPLDIAKPVSITILPSPKASCVTVLTRQGGKGPPFAEECAESLH